MYASDSCNYCKQMKERLSKEGIDFKVRLTEDFKEDWNQVSNLTGMSILPTILYKDNFFIPGRNFSNPDHLIQIINNFEPSRFSNEKIILERINTLNYNISMAFNNLQNNLKNKENNEHKSAS